MEFLGLRPDIRWDFEKLRYSLVQSYSISSEKGHCPAPSNSGRESGDKHALCHTHNSLAHRKHLPTVATCFWCVVFAVFFLGGGEVGGGKHKP